MLDENWVIVLDRNGREKDRYDAANISSARDIARMDRLFGGREADNTRDEFLNRFRPGLRDDVWELLAKYTTDKFNPNRLFPFIEFLSLDGDIKLKELCFQSFLHAGGNKRLFEGLYRGILKVGFNTTGKCESLFLMFFNDVRRTTQKGADLGAYNISFDVKYNMSHSFGLPKYDKKNDRIPTKWAKMLGTSSTGYGEIALFQMLRKMTKSKDNPHPTNAFIFVKKGGETARIIYKEDVVDMINNKRPLKGFSFDLQNGYEGVSMKLENHMRRRNVIKEEVIKKGLDWLADKVSEKTGLEFYGDLESIDYTEEDNLDGVVDYRYAELEVDDETEYLCKYDNGDFGVAFWRGSEYSPYDVYRDPNPFAVAKYAIENTPSKPAIADESRRLHGCMLREGAYNEGKRVWKITAIADNDYEDDVVRYFRTEKAADEAYEDMSKDNTYKFVKEPEEYVIQYNDDIEAEPNYWMDGTVSWIEGDYDFGDYTVEVDGGLPTIAMKFNYNNDYADEDNEIFLQGIDAEIAVNEICDIYSNGDKTPKEAVELWSRQYA